MDTKAGIHARRPSIAMVSGFGGLLLASAFSVGCGKERPVQINARVMLDGEPLNRAAVTFISMGSVSRRPATGMTEPDGSFQLTTYRPNDGILPGEYKVCVSKTAPTVGVEKAAATEMTPENSNFDKYFAAASKWSGSKKQNAIDQQEVPAVYRDPERTPLSCKVPNDAEVIVFELNNHPDEKGD